MLFVYPAVISDKVSQTYLPGIIKTIELYFMDKIVDDIASSRVKLYIKQNPVTQRLSDIRMEHTLLSENLGYDMDAVRETMLLESTQEELAGLIKNMNDKEIDKVTSTNKELLDAVAALKICTDRQDVGKQLMSKPGSKRTSGGTSGNVSYQRGETGSDDAWIKGPPTSRSDTTRDNPTYSAAQKAYVVDCNSENKAVSRAQEAFDRAEAALERTKERIKVLQRSAGEQEKAQLKYDYDVKKIRDEEDRAKRQKVVGGAEGLRVDTTMMLDLRPTSTVLRVPVEVQTRKLLKIIPDTKEVTREIPISVKIIPIIAHNFQDIYSSMNKDLFSNKLSQVFKGAARKFVSGGVKWMGPLAKKLLRTTKDQKNVDVFKDIILGKSGIINSSQFKKGGTSKGKSDRYSSSIVIFSPEDLRNEDSPVFKDPDKLQTLYRLGWKVFAIADDKDQQLSFCSGLEGGSMCIKIPYSHAYKTLQAHDLFKDADQLSRFTSRVIGNFKRTNMKKLTAENKMIELLTIQKVQTLYERFGGK